MELNLIFYCCLDEVSNPGSQTYKTCGLPQSQIPGPGNCSFYWGKERWAHPVVLMGYFWLCPQRSLLKRFRGPFAMPGIKPALSAVLPASSRRNCCPGKVRALTPLLFLLALKLKRNWGWLSSVFLNGTCVFGTTPSSAQGTICGVGDWTVSSCMPGKCLTWWTISPVLWREISYCLNISLSWVFLVSMFN